MQIIHHPLNKVFTGYSTVLKFTIISTRGLENRVTSSVKNVLKSYETLHVDFIFIYFKNKTENNQNVSLMSVS